MYAGGGDHEHKAASDAALRRVAAGGLRGAVDAEVLQEILHRYTSLRRTADRAIVYETAREVFDVVIPITAPVMEGAYGLLRRYARLSARDAVHAAVVLAHDLDAICSYDRDYDAVPGLKRVEPPDLLGPSRH